MINNSVDIENLMENKAYDDFVVVMEKIRDADVLMPEVDSNENGSIELSWSLKTRGTSTIILYGDDYVIFNTYLGSDNYVRSVCKIRAGLLLPKLIEILLSVTLDS